MKFSWWTFALQAANFLILVWLLRRFLFKPVSAIVARRKEEIARGLSEAAAEKQSALDLKQELASQRAAIEIERQQTIDEQRAQLAIEHKKMLEEAHSEANEIRVQAQKKIAEERVAAAEELFSSTIEMAAGLAERLLRELALPSIERPFLGRVIDYLDRLSAQERASLVSHLGANTLTVTTAHQLDVKEEAKWQEQLQKRIGDSATLEFRTDPALIAGAEITFPHAILRFSWRESLAAAGKEIRRNEHSR
jgi:F0F1-type ATP synthase membrane subunit b/b'